MKIGRPSDYRPEYPDLLLQHLSQGYSFESFGGRPEVLVGRATLYRWVDEHQEFRDAKDAGTLASLLHWETLNVDGAMDKSQVNASMWIYTMKCRFRKLGWNDVDMLPEDLTKGMNESQKAALLDYLILKRNA